MTSGLLISGCDITTQRGGVRVRRTRWFASAQPSTMKLTITTIGLAVLAVSTNVTAQYYSEGWKPGQAVTKSATGYTFQTSTPDSSSGAAPTANTKSPFDFSSLLEIGPLKSLFQRAGVNITEKLEAARKSSKIWDERINLITDDNYNDLIVNEKFESLKDEKERVWFLVMSVFQR